MNQKPFFISDFLTPYKKNLFEKMKDIRKQYPQKIKSVFVRRGQISYTLLASPTDVLLIKNHPVLENLILKLRNDRRSNNDGENGSSDNNGENRRSDNGGENRRFENDGENQRSDNGGGNQNSENQYNGNA